MSVSMSIPYPLVRNLSDFSTRRGVDWSPSRSGFSPSSARIWRTRSCMALALYVMVSCISGLDARGQADLTSSPDALYARREEAGFAARAADAWAARLAAAPGDFEAAWKLSRARYYIGTNGRVDGRRAALDAGMAAARTAIALQPAKPEGHFWLAANMGALAESFGMSQGL